MSALGDLAIESHTGSGAAFGRIDNVSIPLLVIHAMDDPLITWQTVASNQGLLHPTNLTKRAAGNLFLLLTKRGGHVGWPMGSMPWESNWKWMNDNAMSFVRAVQKSRDMVRQPISDG